MEKKFSKATFMLLFLSILTLAVIITPMAKAESLSVTLNPSEGPAGTTVMVMISGFQAPDPVSITFGATNVGTIPTYYSYPSASMVFTVPPASPGTYTVTATDNLGGGVAKATFTVTQAPPTTPTSTGMPTGTSASTGTGTSTGLPSTESPVTVSSSGFWSPLAIAITAVVIAFAGFMTAMYVMRGRQKPLSYEEASRHEPRPSTPSTPSTLSTPSRTPTAPSKINQPYQSYRSYQSSKINQPYQPYQPSKINQHATSIQQAPYTRVCRHCKRTVRDDLNICPYCSKRLR